MNVLAIIPARAGSKRLPGKNFDEKIRGKTLVGWAVEQANTCRWRPSIITDAPERCMGVYDASVATEPAELAGDDVAMARVLKWGYQQSTAKSGDLIVLLQPTSPLRLPRDITACVALAMQGNYDSVVSVVRRKRPDAQNTHFETNGAVYVLRPEVLESGECVGGHTGFYVMPPERSIDINTAEDLAEARRLAGD